jgi:hypothetical protein
MKKTFLSCLFMLSLSVPALAADVPAAPETVEQVQVPTARPGSKITFDQGQATLAQAQSYVYKYYSDGNTIGVPLTDIICVDGVPVTCEAPFPAFTPGVTHTIALTATNEAGESAKSVPLSFQFIVVPVAPSNLGIKP